MIVDFDVFWAIKLVFLCYVSYRWYYWFFLFV